MSVFSATERRRQNYVTTDRSVRLTAAGYAAIGKHAPLRSFVNPLREAEATFPNLSLDDRRAGAAAALAWAHRLAQAVDLPEAS